MRGRSTRQPAIIYTLTHTALPRALMCQMDSRLHGNETVLLRLSSKYAKLHGIYLAPSVKMAKK
ncbi:MAG: hypothetical protein A3G24_26030 [Betaproteobacteria bacterium RIFCSPLOWO2_12_FULL_62_13]|nr:MAG: hypothetical protein A3G24_26030 [Betaproteobacteria bacterium RIFCSPLOWO2_12_FULL_62_13]